MLSYDFVNLLPSAMGKSVAITGISGGWDLAQQFIRLAPCIGVPVFL